MVCLPFVYLSFIAVTEISVFATTRVFKHAERINASRLILVGNSEWERGMVRVKILSTREEFEVKAGELE
jgi:histidyl-tRNA synthetase